MKRIVSVVLGAICLNLILMAPALAGSELPPPHAEVITPPGVKGTPAFTGADVTVWMVLAVGLLVVGVGFMLAGRRRRRLAE